MFSFKKWNLFLAVLHLEVAGTENNFSWSGDDFSAPDSFSVLHASSLLERIMVIIWSLFMDATNCEQFWQNPGLKCLDIFHCAEMERRVSVI